MHAGPSYCKHFLGSNSQPISPSPPYSGDARTTATAGVHMAEAGFPIVGEYDFGTVMDQEETT